MTCSFRPSSSAGRCGPSCLPLAGTSLWLVVALVALFCCAASFAETAPVAGEDFETLDYLYARSGSAATDAGSFALAPSASLRLQAGAHVQGLALKWQVRATGPTAVLAITRPTAPPVGEVTLWVKNPYGYAATLTLAAVTADGALLRWPALDLGTSRRWQQM